MRLNGSLFVDDAAALRRKLASLTGHAASLWQGVQERARSGANPWEAAFVAMAEGCAETASVLRPFLLDGARGMWEKDSTDAVQIHTWCECARVTQLAVCCDWVAGFGLFDESEQRALADAFVDFAFRHPCAVLPGRVPSSDNQSTSMLLCGAVVGYLFGHKHGRSQRAREIFAYCFSRFGETFDHFGPDGYSLEGSSYQGTVQVPNVTLMAAFWEWLTGDGGVAGRKRGAFGVSALDALRTYSRCVGAGGLMPAWDNYGFQWANQSMALAYLAKKTGNPGHLAHAVQAGLWRRPSAVLHGNEVDRLYALLWWPDGVADVPGAKPESRSWMLPRTAASLEDEASRTRLFQTWDIAAPVHRRKHTNPNAITFEAFGSPLVLDGMTKDLDPCPPELRASAETVLRGMGDEAKERLMGYTSVLNYARGAGCVQDWLDRAIVGSVGAHNCVVIDGEAWHTSPGPVHGRGEAFASLPGLAMVESESAPFYRPRFDVESVRRRSLLVEGRWAIVEDEVSAESSHRFTWQAFLRPGTRLLNSSTAWTDTPEGVGMITHALDANRLEAEKIKGYPSDIEGASMRLRRSAEGQSARFRTVLHPSRNCRPVMELPPLNASADQVGPRVLRYEFDAPGVALEGEARFLAEETPCGVEAALNGVRLQTDAPVASQRKPANGAPSLVPVPLPVPTGLLRREGNVLELTLPGECGAGALGSVRLAKMVGYPEPPAIAAEASVISLTEAGRTCFVLPKNPGRELLQVGPLSTDAECARVRDAEDWTLLGATKAALGDRCLLESDAPVDAEWRGQDVHLARLAPGSSVGIMHPADGSRLSVQWGSLVDIRAGGAWAGRRLHLPWNPEAVVRCNGREVAPAPDALQERCVFDIPPPDAGPRSWNGPYPDRAEAAFAARFAYDAESAQALLALADDPDWRVRAAAIEGIGKRRIRSAVPKLAETLRSLLGRDENAPETGAEGASESAGLVERYRTKLALVRALAEIGDPAGLDALAEVLNCPCEFYALHFCACKALGKMGGPEHLDMLSSWAEHVEVNTAQVAQEAIGEIRRRRKA